MVGLMEDKLARSMGIDWEESKEEGFGKEEDSGEIRERSWGGDEK